MDGSRPNSAPIHPSNIYKYYRNIITFPSIQLKIMRFFRPASRFEPKTRIIGSIEPKSTLIPMVDSIPYSRIGTRQRIEVPPPSPILGPDGKPRLKNGLPMFNVKAKSADFALGQQSAVSENFTVRYITSASTRAKSVQLAVVFALAETTEWAECKIVLDDYGNLITINDAVQAIITKYGNRSATRTITQLAEQVGATYGAVQKALTFWENEGIMKRINSYEQQSVVDEHRKTGRSIEFRRYEFDPMFVWRGHLWLRNAYAKIHTSGIEIV